MIIRYRFQEGLAAPSAGVVFDPSTNPKAVSRAKQSFAKEVDINQIMARYNKDGILPTPSGRKAFYADVSDVPDLQTTLERFNAAQEQFAALPAIIRKRFGNDPKQLISYMANLGPEQMPEAISLGLVLPSEQAAQPVKPVSESVVPETKPTA